MGIFPLDPCQILTKLLLLTVQRLHESEKIFASQEEFRSGCWGIADKPQRGCKGMQVKKRFIPVGIRPPNGRQPQGYGQCFQQRGLAAAVFTGKDCYRCSESQGIQIPEDAQGEGPFTAVISEFYFS